MAFLSIKLRSLKNWSEEFLVGRVRIPNDREHEIVLNRIAFCIIFALLFYSFQLFSKIEEKHLIENLKLAHLMYSSCAFLILVSIYFNPSPSPARRIAGIFLDISTITAGLYIGGEFFAVGYILYLWTIFGNGFRFGIRYLVTSVILSLAGLIYVASTNPFWRTHPYIVFSMIVGLIILPAYAARLVKKLNDARRKAEEANQAKGMFIASVSHELRTPLTSIIGLGELLQSTSLTAEQDNMVRTIGSAGRSLLRMINSILNIAKAEEGHHVAAPEKIDLFQLVSDIRSMLSVQAQSKETRLVVEINPSTPQFIQSNFRHIEEILLNLIGNAVKFTDRGSVRVLINARPGEAGKLRLRCDIYDTGIGIAPGKQSQIFNRFTQADETIFNQFGGSGLGLAIAKQLVELYNGIIGVKSALGQGSHFWFEIDVISLEQQQEAPVKTASAHVLYPDAQVVPITKGSYKILVAEDNVTNQKIICKILTLAGHHVVAVDNGEMALDALLGQNFDLALMDINMPVMNGVEATRLYHFSSAGHEHTPVIALTADTSEQTRRRCFDAGIRAFCTKPIETDRLIAIIDQVANTYGAKKPVSKPAPVLIEPAIADVQKPSLDPQVLANLARLGGDQFCDDIVAEFLNESNLLAQEVQKAVHKHDIAAFHANIHALQSCAGNVGAARTVDWLVQWQEINAEDLEKSGQAICKTLQHELDAVSNVLFRRTHQAKHSLAS